jgi:hypothetical protein
MELTTEQASRLVLGRKLIALRWNTGITWVTEDALVALSKEIDEVITSWDGALHLFRLSTLLSPDVGSCTLILKVEGIPERALTTVAVVPAEYWYGYSGQGKSGLVVLAARQAKNCADALATYSSGLAELMEAREKK